MRDDGINCSDYVTELVLLPFIKMVHENTEAEILDKHTLPAGCRWTNLNKLSGISSDVHSNNYLIHTKIGSLKCDWVENIAQISLPYHVKQSSKKYTFRNVIRSRLLEGSSLGGDSGSPITTFDGKLIAMHFAGAGTYSYSLPIQQIFSAFNPQLYLVT